MTMVHHASVWTATRKDLAAVPVPPEDGRYVPVPYTRFVDEVLLHIPRFGLTVTGEEWALAQDGQQMFGVLTCQNGHGNAQYAVAVGLRNSYNRTLSVGLVSATRVFVCDNLAFNGEAKVARKHTVHVFRDLPDLIYRMLASVSAMRQRHDDEIVSMQRTALDQKTVDHLLASCVRRNVFPVSELPYVWKAWEEPEHEEFRERTAWSLYNAVTARMKSKSPRVQMDGTLRLTDTFRKVLSL